MRITEETLVFKSGSPRACSKYTFSPVLWSETFHYRSSTSDLWEKQILFLKGICKLLYWATGNKERYCAVYCLMTYQPQWQVIILRGNEEQATHGREINRSDTSQGVKASQLRFDSRWHHKSAARGGSEPTSWGWSTSTPATQVGSSTDVTLNNWESPMSTPILMSLWSTYQKGHTTPFWALHPNLFNSHNHTVQQVLLSSNIFCLRVNYKAPKGSVACPQSQSKHSSRSQTQGLVPQPSLLQTELYISKDLTSTITMKLGSSLNDELLYSRPTGTT